MSCACCGDLARENAALRDELAAWRANDRDEERADEAEGLLSRWKAALPELSYAVLLTVMTLVERPGRICSWDLLIEASRGSPFVKKEDVTRKTADVLICVARTAFRNRGRLGSLPRRFATLDGGIVNHPGLGWSIARVDAQAIRGLIG